jgi:hypothetical protein
VASFQNCVSAALKRKVISKRLADQILSAPDPEQAIDDLLAEASRKRREAAIQTVRLSQSIEDIGSHAEGQYAGLQALMTKDPTGKSGYKNIEYLGRYYEGKYHSKLANMLSRFRTRNLGFAQDTESLNKFVRAVYGEAVDDAEIDQFGKDWLNMIEEMRVEFNRKGGSISKNERFLFPQNHNAEAIKKVGYDSWRDRILPKLDRSKMLDDLGRQLDDEQLEQSLKHVYETITTGGLNKVKDFSVPRLGKKLSRRHSERRFLYFKNAESWIDYQNEFGRGDVFTTLTDYVNSMANDIAVMERLGPNPQTTFDALVAQVKKTDGMTGRQAFMSDALFKTVTGRVNQGELTGVADVLQTTRNYLTASTLGKAFLSAISDIGFQAITSQYNRIPALKVMKRQISLMNPSNEADRVFAVKLGLIADNWIGRAHAANRYADVYGVGTSAKVAEGVMRASLLAPWTDAGRKAFGMEFSSMLADNFGKSLDQLDDHIKRAFETYGIGAADWDAFRKTTPLDLNGAKFADVTQPNGVKFHQMILSETDYAVPTPDARTRAIISGGLGRATIEGQAWRSVMMLKSFPVTIISTHFYRAAYQATTGEKLQYLTMLLATTTVLGGVALQVKDIAAGRDPRPMDGIEFFAASLVQGGGLGIVGDLLFSDVNRFGGGLVSTAFGPTGELVDKGFSLTLGNIQEAVRGEETNVLGETAKFVERYTPDIWQLHLIKGALFDQMQTLADPKAEKKFNRIMRKREKDYGQGYWWKPGEVAPRRTPEMGAALEAPPEK